MWLRRRDVLTVLLAGGAALLGTPEASVASPLPPIKHVFIIAEENESATTTFGAAASDTAALDNYVAMVSGQAPKLKHLR
jgi:hypothetical protein